MPSSSVQAAEGEELTRIRLGLEWFLNADHLPLVIALREGVIFARWGWTCGTRPNHLITLGGRGGDHRREARRRGVTETLHLARDAASGETRARFQATPPRGRRGHAPRIRPACAGPRDMRGSDIAHPGSPGPGGPGRPAIVQTMVGGRRRRVRRLVVREAQRRVPPRPVPRVRRRRRGRAGVWELRGGRGEYTGVARKLLLPRGLGRVPNFCRLAIFSTLQYPFAPM